MKKRILVLENEKKYHILNEIAYDNSIYYLTMNDITQDIVVFEVNDNQVFEVEDLILIKKIFDIIPKN